jgi:hypothetical protein
MSGTHAQGNRLCTVSRLVEILAGELTKYMLAMKIVMSRNTSGPATHAFCFVTCTTRDGIEQLVQPSQRGSAYLPASSKERHLTGGAD